MSGSSSWNLSVWLSPPFPTAALGLSTTREKTWVSFNQKSKAHIKGKAIKAGLAFGFKILTPFVSDIILAAIGFYVGGEKGSGFHMLPFLLLGAIAAGTMILSEVQHFCLR